jgi:hypothetical protein
VFSRLETDFNIRGFGFAAKQTGFDWPTGNLDDSVFGRDSGALSRHANFPWWPACRSLDVWKRSSAASLPKQAQGRQADIDARAIVTREMDCNAKKLKDWIEGE